MTLSRDPVLDDRQLERYLLGLLPDDEAERLDELSVADDDVALQVKAAENDLVDAYVAGRLAGATRARFESFYLASPRRRHKVEFAESLLRAGARDRAAAQEPGLVRESVRPAAGSRASRPSFFWQYAAVAALVTLACGALGIENWRLRGDLNQAQQQNAALVLRSHELEDQAAAQRAAGAATSTTSSRTNSAQNAQRAPAPASAASASPALATALVLLPQSRAVGAIPQIPAPAATENVGFDLRLESNDRDRYEVVLRDPVANQAIWRSGFITAKISDDQPTVSIAVPGRLLKPQHYSFELVGRGADRRDETLGSYTVEVVAR